MAWASKPIQPESRLFGEECIQWMNNQVRDCCDNHTHDLLDNNFIPKRLLDLSNSPPKLVLDAKLDSAGKAHNGDSPPLSCRNAIRTTKALDIRYLWMNSLCILQDSVPDWEQHCLVMDKIYRNAHITLCAASLSSCHESFLTPKGPRINSSAPILGLWPVETRRMSYSVILNTANLPAARGARTLPQAANRFNDPTTPAYSNTSLKTTRPSFAGLARLFHSYLEDKYICGHWDGDFAENLVLDLMTRLESRKGLLPSWSRLMQPGGTESLDNQPYISDGNVHPEYEQILFDAGANSFDELRHTGGLRLTTTVLEACHLGMSAKETTPTTDDANDGYCTFKWVSDFGEGVLAGNIFRTPDFILHPNDDKGTLAFASAIPDVANFKWVLLGSCELAGHSPPDDYRSERI
ncbi:hypothetical protein B0H63DRAFT_506628 [Podospora didyma]|uniref:Heterokaryon incompatibility domain-containing protein n=1 Tax=Podospora didyma TaxID=330526 RepID=A0AAE0P805_9PEZI|nr:hypothetical protein B0H63DRAFT_506628 [Podospora didyma]